MPKLNLTNLREAIYNYLDDDGTRWSAGVSDNSLDMSKAVDRAIKYAMDQSVRAYVQAGNSDILVQKEFTTAANTGKVVLGGAQIEDLPFWVANVALNDGSGVWTTARAARPDEVEYGNIASRRIRVNFIPRPYINTNAGAENGTICFLGDSTYDVPELEILAILYAVKNLLPRDAEQNAALSDAVFQAENAIKGQSPTPRAVEFPRSGRASSVYSQYRWSFIKYDADIGAANVLQIHRPLYSFYNVVS